jgi:starch synthase
MRVLFAAFEIYPYVKTGGLGDVAAALPPALKEQGVDVRFFLPGVPELLEVLGDRETVVEFPVYFGAKARILKGTLPTGLIAYILDAPDFYHRKGLYVDAQGLDWPDNHLRFAAFCRAAADLQDFVSWKPDIIHGNDWHCGLIPAYLLTKSAPQPASVLTIHNIAYQGLFPTHVQHQIGLPAFLYHMEGAEFYGKVGYLKAGLAFADRITTVSPTYAREIQQGEQGCGLDGFLRTRSARICGILNGIDTDIWNPESDQDIERNYDAQNLEKREANKTALLKLFNIPSQKDKPLFAVVSRLNLQKGFDLLLDALPALLDQGANFILLGSGDRDLEEGFIALADDYPGQVGIKIGYDEALSHKIQAGADAIVMPSRSEPCGLVQMYAMRYGALPLVRNTGGLADTVEDGVIGFVFEEEDAEELSKAMMRAMATYKNKKLWREMQKEAMRQSFTWNDSARRYKELYEELTGKEEEDEDRLSRLA